MNARDVREELEAEYETELSRLGSSKAMYAVTGGEMETDAVLGSMADRALAAAETFDAWADDGGPGAGAFADAADEQRDHAERIGGEASSEATPSPTALEEYLRSIDEPAERAAGMAAWALIADRTLSQAVGFFVGNAATSSADTFRDLRSELQERLEAALDLLDEVGDEADRDAALEAGAGAIEAAYDHYVETLEGMGIKVKPVC